MHKILIKDVQYNKEMFKKMWRHIFETEAIIYKNNKQLMQKQSKSRYYTESKQKKFYIQKSEAIGI